MTSQSIASTNKQLFKEILQTTCSERFDVDAFIEYLENQTDFFVAPASTKYHLAERGGLLLHSIHVYKVMMSLYELYNEQLKDIPLDSIAICGLLHDICKTNFYKQEIRPVKTPAGWTDTQVYVIDDKFPIGHGEKSVILLQQRFVLTKDEILAIRWHMNGFDPAVKGGEYAYNNAINCCKLLRLLEVSDLVATRILEGGDA